MQTWFTKLNWSDKTQIIREHRNRLQKVSDNVYRRVIDYYNEGLNPAKSVNRIKSEINNEFLGKFYLAYLSNPGLTQDNTSDPMFIGLFGTQSFCLAPAIANGDVTITLEQGYIYYITDSDIGDNA